MNVEKAVKEAESVFKAYKRKDPLMIRKSVSLKDTAYRRSTPDKEVWHAELAFDHDFYLAVIAGAAAVAVLTVVLRRAVRKLSTICDKQS